MSGIGRYDHGSYVWTDYAYDDRGPNRDVRPGGDSTYPADAVPRGNGADLVQLQLTLDAARTLRVRAVLESLTDPNVPLVGVGIDTDNNAATGASTVPGGQWRATSPLGLDVFVTIGNAGARCLRWTENKWVDVARPASTVDPTNNTLDAVIPANLLPSPATSTWRVVGMAGLATPGHTWLDGSGPIYDLAFAQDGDPSTEFMMSVVDNVATFATGSTNEWQDHTQADVLAGALDSSRAIAVVDTAKLAARVTDPAPALNAGFHTLLYRSHLDLGEGYAAATGPFGEPATLYAGPYQPYLIRVPAGVPQPWPLVVYLHGTSQNHLQSAWEFAPSFTGKVVNAGVFDPPALVVFPLGRGPSVPYTGPAEQDVLDVFADVTRRFPTDLDRVVLSGMSLGGIGTFRLGELYPDRFTGLFSVVGYDQTALPGNLRNVPLRMHNGATDYLVNAAFTLQTRQELDADGTVDYRSWLSVKRQHSPEAIVGNCVFGQLLARPRVVDPSRVTYTVDPANEVADAKSGLHLAHTGAYWVTDIARRAATQKATVDAVSLARADRSTKATTVDAIRENVTAGRDYCGPNPTVQSQDVWHEHGISVAPGPASPTSNAMDLSLTNVARVRLDLARMRLATDRPVTVNVQDDGPITLALAGRWPRRVAVTVDGQPIGVLRPSLGVLTLARDLTGTHTVVLTPWRG